MRANVRLITLLAMALVFWQTGCVSLSGLTGAKREPSLDVTMLKAQGYSLPPGGMPSPLPTGVQLDGTNVVVEIRGDEPKMTAIPLPANQSATVEDLYRKLELADSLGASHVSIMRPTPNGPPVRLAVMINAKGKATNPGHNYALHPNDHIIVVSDGRTLFERYLDRKLGKE